jgi:putative PIN family toxin of toxin-antitoxin system
MARVRVVLDTNVLYAGLYSKGGASHRVLRAIERGAIRTVLSIPLLFEYEELLRRRQDELGLTDVDIEEVLDGLCARARHQQIYFLWRPYLADPKDDHLLELAVASGTRTVVTHNTKHFREATTFGVRAVTPRQLLEDLL